MIDSFADDRRHIEKGKCDCLSQFSFSRVRADRLPIKAGCLAEARADGRKGGAYRGGFSVRTYRRKPMNHTDKVWGRVAVIAPGRAHGGCPACWQPSEWVTRLG